MKTQELQAPSTRKRRLRGKIGKRVIFYALALYFVPLIFLMANQRELIFKPDYYSSTQWKASRLPVGAERVTLHTRDGNIVPALFGRALSSDGQLITDYRHLPTILYFHGNSAGLMELGDDFVTFRRMGVNVLMPEYVGFGSSTGQPSENGSYETADAAFAYLRHRPDIDSSRLVITGHSLGTAVAIDLTARLIHAKQPVAGLAIFSGFTNMPEEAHSQYPIYPAWLLRLVVRFPFDSERKMAGITCPVLIVHSLSDDKVPYWMPGRLAAACRGKVTRLTIDHVPHGAVFSAGAPIVIPAFKAFIMQTCRE